MSLETTLRSSAARQSIPCDFHVLLDDVHPLHGGVRLQLFANRLEAQQVEPGGLSTVTRRFANPEDVVDLLKVLVEIRAWDEALPARAPVAGGSVVKLTVQANARRASWLELANELESNDRLVRVRRWLEAYAKQFMKPLEAFSPPPPLEEMDETDLTRWFDHFRGLDRFAQRARMLPREELARQAQADGWTLLELPFPMAHPGCDESHNRIGDDEMRIEVFPVPPEALRGPDVAHALQTVEKSFATYRALKAKNIPSGLGVGETLARVAVQNLYEAIRDGFDPSTRTVRS